MTKIDNSKIFHEGSYADITLTVPASTTYKAGTVLGRNASGDLTAFSTDNNVAPTTSDLVGFTTSPLYILAQTVTNESTTAAEDIPMVRVFEEGVVDASKLIFIKSADATDADVLDALKTNGYKLRNVQDVTVDSNLA